LGDNRRTTPEAIAKRASITATTRACISGGGVPVGHPHRTVALAASTTLVAHQLVDHPAGDPLVLQPGREGMTKVVWASKVQVGEGSGRDRREPAGASVVPDR
jgi:hypothetical protein